MKLMKSIISIVLIGMTVGCVSPINVDDQLRIQIGMSRSEVMAILGKPIEIKVSGKSEYLMYSTKPIGRLEAYRGEVWKDNFYRFIDGRLESFGQMGDFDSTKDPTQKIIIDKTDKITMDSVTKFDLATELAKLDKLKKDGLISAEDYELLKKRAIEKAKE